VIILDTNVLSELMKVEPTVKVFGWVNDFRREDLFTTAISQAEILFGLAVMPDGRKKESLRDASSRMFEHEFRGRILPFGRDAAQPYADILASRRRTGRPMDDFDAQIASIAAHRGMAVATRDVGGFEDCGIEVINPWTA
jgi:predicted nucleic acid-binding protein